MPYIFWVIVIAVLAIFIGKRVFSVLSGKQTISARFQKRKNVMNPSERELYTILKKTFDDKYIVLSKVRIEDFINVETLEPIYRDKQSLRGKIKSRHVDFLICDLLTTEPLYAIELDGYSHTEYSRIQRDDFVNGLYQYVGLPVVHIKVGSDFYVEVDRIKDLLTTNSVV